MHPQFEDLYRSVDAATWPELTGDEDASAFVDRVAFERPAAKPLLVGELNPYGADPAFALYPLPVNSAGGRLCSLVLGMRRGAYLAAFDRVNLCAGKWSAPGARRRAAEVLGEQAGDRRRVLVLLGAKVFAAFGFVRLGNRAGEAAPVAWEPFSLLPSGGATWAISVIDGRERAVSGPVVVLPHPSGLCRIWNEPGAFERARAALRAAGVQLGEPSEEG